MLLFLTVVLAAVIFEYTNGFHDAANAIATVVSTKVLTPRQAIAMAAFFNLTGALLGGAVATTVGKGLVDTEVVTMGTVLSALLAPFTGTKAGRFDHLPVWLEFLRTPVFAMPLWVKVLCAATMAVGTAAGGWRIIRTLGHRVVKLQPVHGFAAETSAALIIQAASIYGIPLSTTHVISTSIMGVGSVKRFSGMRWTVVERIIWAWIFTLPATGLIGYLFARLAG